MSKKLVQKCDCCESRFSSVRITPLPITYRSELLSELQLIVQKLGLKGEPSLVVTSEVIIACHYVYENALEERKSATLCDQFGIAARSIYRQIINASDVDFFGIDDMLAEAA